MQVYSLLGFVDYEGSSLLGVFGSVEDVQRFVESRSELRQHYHDVGYVVSQLGQEVDVLGDVVYL